jgi:Tfp pilus assembly protein FimT
MVELLPVILVASVMIAFIGVPVFLSWWRNRQ